MNASDTMNRIALWLIVATLCLIVSPAFAQVRTAPQGNSLPTEVPAVDIESLHELAGLALAGPIMDRATHEPFAEAVDLSQFRKLAVFHDGRTKILDTLAREQINRVYGKTRWKDLVTDKQYDALFTYLDLVFNPRYYADKPLIQVEVLPLRYELLAYLPAEEQEVWLKRGRITPIMLSEPHMQRILTDMNMDLRLIKAQRAVLSAVWTLENIGKPLAMVSPPPGGTQWAHITALSEPRLAAADGGTPVPAVQVADPELAQQVSEQFQQLAVAWRAADAAKVNTLLANLSEQIPQLNPASYPPLWKRQLEHLYNLTHRFTIGYVAYLIGTFALLLAFAVNRKWMVVTGAGLLISGLLVHSAGMLVRGILSGRWPIHNQFESFVAITWFAVLVGVVFMFARRQWLFGAAASALGAAALFVANTMDIPSNDVGQVAGILATSRILYIHVNMVLVSYALIALAFFISLFYLAVYYARGGAVIRMAAAGLGQIDETSDQPTRGRHALLNDLDKAHMIMLQLAFWLLGAGILLGAYWADHAWGRWWAWDPKETWALATWIIYLIAIHVRFGVKNRGLVTAWLSVIGFIVMLWTYWGVNMLLAGLHSYA